MNNKLKKLMFFLSILFLVSIISVRAVEIIKLRVISDVGLNMRSEPTTASSRVMEAKDLPKNTILERIDTTNYTGAGCSDPWFKVRYNSYEGYVCSSFVESYTVVENPSGVPTNDCETDLNNKGFPSSYWGDLCALKNKYPNWNFIPDFNHLDFNSSVKAQNVDRKALIQDYAKNIPGYLATDYLSYNYLTDSFNVKEGSNWYNASYDTIAFYMDPRNFFNEKDIFMFEKLSFNGSYQTVAAIESILAGTDIREKAGVIYDAGSRYNANAIYLASRIKMETTGMYSGVSLAGHAVGGYAHIYNPYNIGAYTGAWDGLNWAAVSGSYLRPWTTLDTAIYGGAMLITSTYIGIGQDTTYFQKFDVSSYSQTSPYSHQYQTNVQGPVIEAAQTYKGYAANNFLGTVPFEFVIPVYEGMPASAAKLPNPGNPNNHLSTITIGGKQIPGFSHDNFTYNYYVAKGASAVNVEATAINGKATISGNGRVSLPNNETSITISVKAQNGAVQDYVIKVIKTDGMDMSVDDIMINMGAPVSGDLLIYSAGLTIDKLKELVYNTSATATVTVEGSGGIMGTGNTVTIANGNDVKTFTMVVKGDPNGDGNINILDLLSVQKYLLGYNDLPGSYGNAADVNRDGVVNILDLLMVQKHILGYTTIS